MQKDLDKLRRHKRRTQRVMVILILSMGAALLVVGIRSCSEQYQEPYNSEYRPMDVEQPGIERP